jgi:hypothetical protein
MILDITHRDFEKRVHRVRKLLTMEPSTPVIKDGPISAGNAVAAGRFSMGIADVEA